MRFTIKNGVNLHGHTYQEVRHIDNTGFSKLCNSPVALLFNFIRDLLTLSDREEVSLRLIEEHPHDGSITIGNGEDFNCTHSGWFKVAEFPRINDEETITVYFKRMHEIAHYVFDSYVDWEKENTWECEVFVCTTGEVRYHSTGEEEDEVKTNKEVSRYNVKEIKRKLKES